jgi:hypothetical protein
MVALTDYFENTIINHMLRNQSFTPASTLYLGLFTVAPGETGGGTEVSGGGYARQSFTLTAASGGASSNTADIVFGPATANWGTIVAVAIFDASTGGNMLMYGNLTTSKTVNSGDVFKILAGDLDITFD